MHRTQPRAATGTGSFAESRRLLAPLSAGRRAAADEDGRDRGFWRGAGCIPRGGGEGLRQQAIRRRASHDALAVERLGTPASPAPSLRPGSIGGLTSAADSTPGTRARWPVVAGGGSRYSTPTAIRPRVLLALEVSEHDTRHRGECHDEDDEGHLRAATAQETRACTGTKPRYAAATAERTRTIGR